LHLLENFYARITTGLPGTIHLNNRKISLLLVLRFFTFLSE